MFLGWSWDSSLVARKIGHVCKLEPNLLSFSKSEIGILFFKLVQELWCLFRRKWLVTYTSSGGRTFILFNSYWAIRSYFSRLRAYLSLSSPYFILLARLGFIARYQSCPCQESSFESHWVHRIPFLEVEMACWPFFFCLDWASSSIWVSLLKQSLHYILFLSLHVFTVFLNN